MSASTTSICESGGALLDDEGPVAGSPAGRGPGRLAVPRGESPEDDDPKTESFRSSWAPVDVGATVVGLLNGSLSRPAPSILTRSDGRCLFYKGKVNGLAGASGDGKSLVAQWACAEEINACYNVIYIDLEDDIESVVGRLLAMGVSGTDIAEHFVYISPDEPYGFEARCATEALVAERAPSLVVIDSTGESLALDGAKPNDDDDVARWFRSFPAAVARLGPAVVVIDHMTKTDDGSLSPIGSQRKRAAIGGAQYITTLTKPFAMGQAGSVKITCGKDRNGTYRRKETVAEVLVVGSSTEIKLTVGAPDAPSSESFRPTLLMERVSRHLELAAGPLTRNQIREQVTGNAPRVVAALDRLVAEQFVSMEIVGQAHLHTSVRAFREDDESDRA